MLVPARGPGDSCTRNLECDSGFCGSAGCTTPPGDGDPCDPHCTWGFWCDPRGGTRVCRPKLDTGEVCIDPSQCLDVCRDGTCQLLDRCDDV